MVMVFKEEKKVFKQDKGVFDDEDKVFSNGKKASMKFKDLKKFGE